MFGKLMKHTPLVVILIFLTGLFALTYFQIVNRMDGHFIYAIDDAYIHMAVGQNLVDHGVWGTQATGFSAATSSLLYPIMITIVYAVVGSGHDWVALVLNVVASYGVVVTFYRILQQEGASDRVTFIFLVLFVMASPIIAVAFMGMEHIFQIWFFILFIYHVSKVAAAERGTVMLRDYGWLFFLAILQTGIRYEGIFTLVCVAVVFLLRLRILPAISTLLIGSLPLVLFGVYSVSEGSLPIPNSVYLKGSVGTYNTFADYLNAIRPDVVLASTYQSSVLWLMVIVVVLGAVLAVFRWRNAHPVNGETVSWQSRLQQFWTPENVLVLLFIGNTILHNQFTHTSFLRYEAYLMGGFFLICGILLTKILKVAPLSARRRVSIAVGLMLVALCLMPTYVNPALRSASALLTPDWVQDIYWQQYQFMRFMDQELPPGTVVAINDIGTTSYYTDIPYLDLYGLANVEIARAGGMYTIPAEDAWNLFEERHAEYAIVYDDWVQRLIPPGWVPVAQWSMPNYTINYGETIAFYAADSQRAETMLAGLHDYESQLPEAITVRYLAE